MTLRNALVPAIVLILPFTASADALRVSGSDLMTDSLGPVLTDFSGRSESVELVTAFPGSIPALEALRESQADVAIVAVRDDDALPSGELTAVPLAFEVALVVVNSSNPLRELGLPKVAGIYGATGARPITKWGDAGVQDGWAARSVSALAPEPSAAITRGMLQHVALGDGELRGGIPSVATRSQALDRVAQDATAVAVVSGGALPANVRALYISTEDGGYAYPPTEDSVFFANYPLRLPFYVVFRTADADKVRPLVSDLLSDDTAARLTEAGLLPVPRTERRDALMRLGQ